LPMAARIVRGAPVSVTSCTRPIASDQA
jgi:hypothetical protein